MLANEQPAHPSMIFATYAKNTKAFPYLMCQQPDYSATSHRKVRNTVHLGPSPEQAFVDWN